MPLLNLMITTQQNIFLSMISEAIYKITPLTFKDVMMIKSLKMRGTTPYITSEIIDKNGH